MITKLLIGILTALGILGGGVYAQNNFGALNIFTGPQGGTGIGTTTAGNIGKVLAVSSVNPLIWTLATDQTGGGGGTGSNWLFTAAQDAITPSTTVGVILRASSTLSYLGSGGVGANNGRLYAGATTTYNSPLNYANGAVTLSTSGAWSGTAGSLAADGSNCSAGNFPLGVDTLGAVQTCTDAWTEAENTSAAYISDGNTLWDNSYGFITWPFIPTTYGNSTTSVIAFSNGLISGATTTISYLGTGGVGANNGRLYNAATTTFSSGITYLNGNATADLGTSIDLASGEVTGDLPFSNIAQLAANSVWANNTAATADGASIGTSTLFGAGITPGFVLTASNGAWTPMATATCLQITGGSGLCDGVDNTGGGGTGSNWAFTAAQDAITPTTTVGIIANASSSIDRLFSRLSTSTNATSTNLFSTLGRFTNLEYSAGTSTGLSYFTGGLLATASSSFSGQFRLGSSLRVLNDCSSGVTACVGTASLAAGLYFGANVAGLNVAGNKTFETTDTTAYVEALELAGDGLVKSGTGLLGIATAGTDYQAPISATYPILYSANVVSTALSTTTNNRWSGENIFANASTTIVGNATTTGYFFAGTASSSLLFGGKLSECSDPGDTLNWNAGVFSCGTDAEGAGGAFPYELGNTNYATNTNSTSTPIWFKQGLFASSTSRFVYASTTALTVSGQARFDGGLIANNPLQMWGGNSVVFYSDTGTTEVGSLRFGAADQLNIGGTIYDAVFNLASLGAERTYTFPDKSLTFAGINNETFTGLTTFANATSSLFSTNYASSTLYYGAGLANCASENMLTWTDGRFGCEADTAGAGGAFPFELGNTNYATNTNSTSTPIWFKQGLFASSTSHFVNASSTLFTVLNTLYTPTIYGDSNGLYVATPGDASYIQLTTANIDIKSNNSRLVLDNNGSYIDTPTRFEFVPRVDFDTGFLSSASSTINANATTTGMFYASTASSSLLFGAKLAACNGSSFLQWAAGEFGCGTPVGGGSFPFTPQLWGNATGTVLSFPGFISTASSTLSHLGSGGLGVNNGLIYNAATTTYSGGLTYAAGNVTNAMTAGDGITRNTDDLDCDTASGSVFGCLASADWTTFNNKIGWGQATSTAANQFVYTNNAGLFVSAASSSLFGYTPLNPTRNLTVAGTANQITSSAAAQDLSADRTWTLSLPQNLQLPLSFTSTYGTTTYASSTALTSTRLYSTNATTTNLNASGQVDFDTLTSALILTGAGGILAEYAGASCTNQFVRSLDALGAATCATVGAADVALANLTATNATLTFSGTYDGSTARTIGLNLGNANTWTALQNFGNASSTQLSVPNAAWFGSTATSTFTSAGWLGIASTSPFKEFTVTGESWVTSTSTTKGLNVLSPTVGTSTIYLYSKTAGFGGQVILEDQGGGACTAIVTAAGTVSGKVVSCPSEL